MPEPRSTADLPDEDGAPGPPPWSEPFERVLARAGVSGEKGLEGRQAKGRRKKYGRNRLRQKATKNAGAILLNQFKSIIILILVAAAALSIVFTNWIDGAAIAAAVLLNTVIGFFMELKAVRSMEALRKMEQITAKVLRSGRLVEIHAAELVPGDIVVFEGGDIVSADMRLIEASRLQVDESMLTGESVPVAKQTGPVAAGAPLSGRANMLFKGTSINRGSGRAVVTSTGMQTELGRICALVEESEDEFTPLEKRLGRLGQKLLWITLATMVVVAALGIIRGKDPLLMVKTAVALAVAAVPEGLPVVATVCMARGMLRMARRNALVNRLAAVETLGGTNVIFTDKTGTLTENRLTVTCLVAGGGGITVRQGRAKEETFHTEEGPVADPGGDRVLGEALKIMTLCNNASLDSEKEGVSTGDPLETALLAAAARAGLTRQSLLERLPEQREEAFDTATKMMATFHKADGCCLVAVKGAPEAVLKACSAVRYRQGDRRLDGKENERWLQSSEGLAAEGLRVLALARKQVDSADADPYVDLTLIGLAAMMDPPRRGVSRAIALCRHAGLKVVMVTGDHPRTALKIACQVGLAGSKNEKVVEGSRIKPPAELSEQQRERLMRAVVFARVSPEQKLHLVNVHKEAGSIVAMTGDGVNDAPGLRRADIGVAMGLRGTQVAREASDMVLKDDSFSTIVEAVRQGRIIFSNIRKFIVYLLSGNVSEIMIVLAASLLNCPLPILPLQILLLNIIIDVFPALALGLGEGSGDAMEKPPRNPAEPVLTSKHWAAVFGYGLLIALPVMAAFAVSLGPLETQADRAVTVSFLTLAFARLWHVFNMRDRGTGFFRNEITGNKYIWLAAALCILLILAVVCTPGISSVLKLAFPDLREWPVIIAASLIPVILGQLIKGGARQRRRQ